MRRSIAAVLMAALSFAQPAAAQTSSERQAVAEVQILLADVGRWSQEYLAVINQAVQPLSDIQSFVDILDRFTDGDIRASQARSEIEAWRSQSLSVIALARVAAERLRPPPSLSILGPEGADMDRALQAARDNALPIVHEFESVVNACAELGLEAIRDTSKGFEARQRALLRAQMQLVRVDLGRIDLSVAAVAPTHPTHHVARATQHYYAALLAVPDYALQELDGGGDRDALVASLRQSAEHMRASLAEATSTSEQIRERLRAQLGGPAVEVARTGLRVFETYPASIRAYSGLADNIDRVATAIERGDDVLMVWGDQEEWDMPFLNEIDRLDRVRADLLANNAGAL